MEMKVQIVVDVIPISVAHLPYLLHHNNVGITYIGTSNFKMELERFVQIILWQCLCLWLQLLKFHLQQHQPVLLLV
jgi:hypothetical protein